VSSIKDVLDDTCSSRTKDLEMKKTARKLSLNTQTVRLLTRDALEQIRGGYEHPQELTEAGTCSCPPKSKTCPAG
jgi:hypothetical protein